MSAAPLAVRQGPPRLGEHNAEILAALDLDRARLTPLDEMRVVHPGRPGQAVGCDTGRTER
jgi:hypothetical protein